jgi:hypothetical protein
MAPAVIEAPTPTRSFHEKVLRPLILGILIASVSSLALAEGRHGSRHPGNSHGNYGNHGKHGSHRAAEWLGALVVLGLAGAAINAAASTPEPARPPCQLRFTAHRLRRTPACTGQCQLFLRFSQTVLPLHRLLPRRLAVGVPAR